MMSENEDNKLSEETVKYIIARVLDNANTALEDEKQTKDDDYSAGRLFAYYEILDTIKNELIVREQDLKDFGLNINLEKVFL